MNEITEKSKVFLQVKNTLLTKEFEFKQLRNFFNNISASSDLIEEEKEALIKIVTDIIYDKFPKKAKSIFGKKSDKAKILLEEVLNSLLIEFDWSNNKVDTRVKNGGDMISGRQHVCHYISYKNSDGINIGFIYRHIKPIDEPFIEINKRYVGKLKDKEDEILNFDLEQLDEAVDLYKNYLKEVIN